MRRRFFHTGNTSRECLSIAAIRDHRHLIIVQGKHESAGLVGVSLRASLRPAKAGVTRHTRDRTDQRDATCDVQRVRAIMMRGLHAK